MSTTTLIPGLKATPAPAERGARGPGVSSFLTLLDWTERFILLGLFVWLNARMVTQYLAEGGLYNLLLLPSEGLVVLFVLVRRGTADVSRRPGEWLLALLATCAPLLVAGGGDGLAPPAVAAVVMLVGMFVQLHAKLTLGRSMGCVPANRGLKLTGPYRFVRHPMYAGYLLSHLAFLAMNPTPWNLGVYVLAYSLQVPRLLAEERLLGRDPAYQRYQALVRHRLIPGVF